VRRRYQWLVLVVLGGVVLRTASTDTYLRYVQPFMRPVLLATGAILLLLGIADALRTLQQRDRGLPAATDPHAEHGTHQAPRMAWLLLLPVACVVTIGPPALGSFSADRAVDVSLVDDRSAEEIDLGYPPLPPGPVVPITLSDYSMRAWWDTAGSLEGRTLRLTGFVTRRPEGGWYLTRMTLQCCAADAAALRVTVLGAPAPPVDQWVTVEGTWVPSGPLTDADVISGNPDPPQLHAARVTHIDVPREPYE
jgi:uncharacterized repeat protein (TIGR03943 family)